MGTIGSISASSTTPRQIAASMPTPMKINDGDADDMPKAVAPTRLATSGPGQLVDKLA